MGKFLRGLLFGMGLGLLVAPMRGQDLRRLLSERFQNLRGYLPENTQQGTNPGIQQDSSAETVPLQKVTMPQSEQHAPSPQSSQVGTPRQTAPLAQFDQLAASPASISNSRAVMTEKVDAAAPLLNQVPGMEPATQRMLEAEGIGTVFQLLKRTATKEERTALAQKVGMNAHTLRTLANRADLMRLEGIGPDVAMLLDEAGVNGCKDLQRRNAERLQATLTETKSRKRTASRAPSLTEITEWIAEAMEVAATTTDE